MLVKPAEGPLRLLTHEQAERLLGIQPHKVSFRSTLNLRKEIRPEALLELSHVHSVLEAAVGCWLG